MAYSIDSVADCCYPGTSVLINKLGLQNQTVLDEAESIAVSLRTTQILTSFTDNTPFTFAFYCDLHKQLFGDIYDWAGTLRTINLSKKGTAFYPAEKLAELGKAKFRYLQENHEFCNLPRKSLVDELADFYHELNMLHPFREGNGRTQRLFFTLLLRRAGYEIRFANCDTDALMMATIYAAQGIPNYLYDFFDTEIKKL